MRIIGRRVTSYVLVIAVFASVLFTSGCGIIADKDRKRIAKLRNEYITRGDLKKVLRDLPDDQRPRIETKDDVKKALEDYLDRRIKKELGANLKAEGRIHQPREEAEAQFAREYPEFQIDIPNPEDYGIAGSSKALEEERQSMIDRIQERMLGERAVDARIREAKAQGSLIVTKEELEAEFNEHKADLNTMEKADIRGIWFEAAAANANEEASAIRARLDAGEKFDDIANTFPPDRVFSAELENNPRYPKFSSFWLAALGAAPGTIVGPLPIPSPRLALKDAQGLVAPRELPDILLIARIEESEPSRPMSFEEAMPYLQPRIEYRKTMEALYKEYGREIYDDNLEDPALFAPSSSSKPLAGPRKPAVN
jgi:hypothetical protein